jgi:hypothetical protein
VVEMKEKEEIWSYKKREIVKRLKEIWQYRCDGCLADTGGCSCAVDKDIMISKLIDKIEKDKI